MRSTQRTLGCFESLFIDDVKNGFPKQIPIKELEKQEKHQPEKLRDNLMFGTPNEIIAKLKRYKAFGVNEFMYYPISSGWIEKCKYDILNCFAKKSYRRLNKH